ncbi:hypothetical protein VTJ04DRAFT_6588 [Mycothermus thermophilus]|uniref:uncharacterized protein n=1 Tax=Humicola insolens TaxID=85995 RepID=UPI0037448A86
MEIEDCENAMRCDAMHCPPLGLHGAQWKALPGLFRFSTPRGLGSFSHSRGIRSLNVTSHSHSHSLPRLFQYDYHVFKSARSLALAAFIIVARRSQTTSTTRPFTPHPYQEL